MKNLKISMKLFIGFGSILAMFVACVVFAAFGLRSISNNLDQFYQRPFANVALAIQADMDSEVAAKYMLRACLEVGSAETSEMLDKSAEYLQDMRNNLTMLKEKYSGNQSDITAVEDLIDELENDFNTYAELARANRNDEAYAVYKAEIVSLLTDITAAVGTVTDQANSFATTSHDSGMASSRVTTVVLIVAGVVAVLVGVVLALYITKTLTSTISQLKDASQRMSEGDFNAQITYESKDELGVLADSMRSLIENMRGIVHDVDYCLGEMGRGNFAVDSRDASAYVGDFHGILDAFLTLRDTMNDTLMQIDVSADQVNSGGEQVSSGAQALAQGATEQAASVQELAATINGIAEQVKTTAQLAGQAEEDDRRAGEEIQQCSAHMNELMAAMQVINDKSKEISKVVKTIEDIAFQTNILALNAAVEAARAGSAGKGFAVVADEVRNLATKSQEAAGSTTTLIDETVKAVQNGSQLSVETEKALQAVVEDAEKVLNAVTSISGATADQSDAIAQVTTGIDQISSVVQTNSATAEQSAAASEELSAQAKLLKDLVGKFTLSRDDHKHSSVSGGSGGGDYASYSYAGGDKY